MASMNIPNIHNLTHKGKKFKIFYNMTGIELQDDKTEDILLPIIMFERTGGFFFYTDEHNDIIYYSQDYLGTDCRRVRHFSDCD